MIGFTLAEIGIKKQLDCASHRLSNQTFAKNSRDEINNEQENVSRFSSKETQTQTAPRFDQNFAICLCDTVVFIDLQY